ncbi:MAG TPA: ABC transporter permease [Candidatus Limnocylindria bacterium]|nr:ABC transporter permease [Candidatus Limnocylindria bacterium]
MSLRRALAITARLLAGFRHDRRTLGILFMVPLVMLGLFALLLRHDPIPVALGVINQDAGPLGGAIVEELRASDRLDVSEPTSDVGRAQLEDGTLQALIWLPEDLTATVAGGGALRPQILLRGTDPSASALTLQTVQQAILAALGAQNGGGGARPPALEPQVTYRYGGETLDGLDLLGGPFVGLVIFFLVYVVTSISFLRERSLGTLERLMASPLRRGEIVVGYMLGFSAVAVVQSVEVLLFSLLVLNIYNAGSVVLIFGIELLLALAAVNLGIFLSTFARSEFEAVQFIPMVVAPQILLSGVIVPVASEPEWLQVVSNVLPLTYAVDALRSVMLEGADLASGVVLTDVAVLAAFCVATILAAAATLRRTVA